MRPVQQQQRPQYDAMIGIQRPRKDMLDPSAVELVRTMGIPVPDSHPAAVLCPRRADGDLANKGEHQVGFFRAGRFILGP